MSTRSLLTATSPSPAPAAEPSPRRRPAVVVAGSLLAGLAAAVALVAGPLGGRPGSRDHRRGCCSVSPSAGRCWPCCRRASPTARSAGRRSPPPRWASAAPGSSSSRPAPARSSALGWVWPPLLLALVVWMIVHARRRPSSRLQPWLLYPVFGVLALTAIGGGYETLRNATDRRPGARSPAAASSTSAAASAEHPLHRLGRPDRRPRTGTRRVRAGDGALDRPRRRAHHDGLRLRPRRSRAQRRRPPPARDAARDLHVLLERAHVPGPVRARRAFARRHVRAELRPPLPGRRSAASSCWTPCTPTSTTRSPAWTRCSRSSRRWREPGSRTCSSIPRTGDPTAQARQFVRDVDEMPAELDRAAKLTSLGNTPLVVVTRRHRLASGLGRAAERPRHALDRQRPPHRSPAPRTRRSSTTMSTPPDQPRHPRRRQGRAASRPMSEDHGSHSPQPGESAER